MWAKVFVLWIIGGKKVVRFGFWILKNYWDWKYFLLYKTTNKPSLLMI
jgi:hypothetical protein